MKHALMNNAHYGAAIHHDAAVQDQFTRQAEPFAGRHGRGTDALLDAMAACGKFRAEDTLLDVAARREGDVVRITCPVAVLAWRQSG